MTARSPLTIFSNQHRPDLLEKAGLALTHLKSNAFDGRKVTLARGSGLTESTNSIVQKVLFGFVYVAFAAFLEPIDLVGRLCLQCSSTHTVVVDAYLKVQRHENAKQKLGELCQLALTANEEILAEAKTKLQEAIQAASLEALWGVMKEASAQETGLYIELMEDSKLCDLLNPNLVLSEGAVQLHAPEALGLDALSSEKLAYLLSHKVGSGYPNAALLKRAVSEDHLHVFNEAAFDVACLKDIDYTEPNLNTLLEHELLVELFTAINASSSADQIVAKDKFDAALVEKSRIDKEAKGKLKALCKKIHSSWIGKEQGLEGLLKAEELPGKALAQIYIDSPDQAHLDIALALLKMPEGKRASFVQTLADSGIVPDFVQLVESESCIISACARCPKYQESVLKAMWHKVPHQLDKVMVKAKIIEKGEEKEVEREESEVAFAKRYTARAEVAKLTVLLNDPAVEISSIINIGKSMPNKLSLALVLMSEERREQLMAEFEPKGALKAENFALKYRGTSADPADLTLPWKLAKEAEGLYASLSPNPFEVLDEKQLFSYVDYLTPEGVVSRVIKGEGVTHSRFNTLNWMHPKRFMAALLCTECPTDIFTAGIQTFSPEQKREILLGWKVEIVAAYALSSEMRLKETLAIYTEPTRRKALTEQLKATSSDPKITLAVTEEQLDKILAETHTDYAADIDTYAKQCLDTGASVDANINTLPLWALYTVSQKLNKDPKGYTRLVKALTPENRVWIFSNIALVPPFDKPGCVQLFDSVRETLDVMDQMTAEEQMRAYPCMRPDINRADICSSLREHLFCHVTDDLQFPFADLFIKRYSKSNPGMLFDLLGSPFMDMTYDLRFDIPQPCPAKLIRDLCQLLIPVKTSSSSSPHSSPPLARNLHTATAESSPSSPKTPSPARARSPANPKPPSKQDIMAAFYTTICPQVGSDVFKGFIESLCGDNPKEYTLGNLVVSLASSDTIENVAPQLIQILEIGPQHIPLHALHRLFSSKNMQSLLALYPDKSRERTLIAEAFLIFMSQLADTDSKFWLPEGFKSVDSGFLRELQTFLLEYPDQRHPLVKRLSGEAHATEEFRKASQGLTVTKEEVAKWRVALEHQGATRSFLPFASTAPAAVYAGLGTPMRHAAHKATLSKAPHTPVVQKPSAGGKSSAPIIGSAKTFNLRLVMRRTIESEMPTEQVVPILRAIQCPNVMIMALRELTRSDRDSKIEILKAILPDAIELLNANIIQGLCVPEALLAATDYLQKEHKWDILKGMLAQCGTHGMPEFNWLACRTLDTDPSTGKLSVGSTGDSDVKLTKDTLEIIMHAGIEQHDNLRTYHRYQKVQFLVALLERDPEGFKFAWGAAAAACSDVVESFKYRLRGDTLGRCLESFLPMPRHALFLEVIQRLLKKPGEISNLVQRPEVKLPHLVQIATAFVETNFWEGDLSEFISALLTRITKRELIAKEVIPGLLHCFEGSEERLIRALGQKPALHHFMQAVAHYGTQKQLLSYVHCLSASQDTYLAPRIDCSVLNALGEAYSQLPDSRYRLNVLARSLRDQQWDYDQREDILKALMGELYAPPKGHIPDKLHSPKTPRTSGFLARTPERGNGIVGERLDDSMELTPVHDTGGIQPPTPSSMRSKIMRQTVDQGGKAQGIEDQSPEDVYIDMLKLEAGDIVRMFTESNEKEHAIPFIQYALRNESFSQVEALINEALKSASDLCFGLVAEVLGCEEANARENAISGDLALRLMEKYTDPATAKLPRELKGLTELLKFG